MKQKLISAAMSYLRAALAAVVALAMSGVTDPKVLANAFIAGLLGPILKAVDPKHTKYGVGAK
jgi:hypothetical protein